MIAANVAEVGAGVTDINDVVQAVHKHVNQKLLPIGEGAYQDPKAVEQRTTDKKKHCEQGKWNHCYGDKGDFLDGHSYGNHQAPLVPHFSAAPSLASGAGLMLALLFAAMQ